MTNAANLDWWNRMGTTDRDNVWEAFKIHWTCCLEKIKVENNTKDLANDVVGVKRGDENEDETNPFFPDNEDDSNIHNNEKVNDGRDEIKLRMDGIKHRNSPNKKKLKKAEEASKEENKSGNQQKGEEPSRQRFYSNSKEALEILLEKMGSKENPIDSEIDLEDETPEQSLERIAASHNMTVEELLVENKIFKDDNPENLPEKKIERKAEEDRMSVEEGDESQEERSTHRKEEDNKNEEEVASERDPIEEAGNNTAQIAVATNPTLQENDTDKNEEAAANDTDPIAVAADHALEEDRTENMEE
eukprot:jgi/Psemu1/429/gm1.429_g